VLALAGACAAWGLDNNLTQRLSLRDPVAVVRFKTLAAGSCNLVLGLALGQSIPRAQLVAGRCSWVRSATASASCSICTRCACSAAAREAA